MSRSRFVKPAVTRLYLVDVHKRALADLRAQQAPRKATADELAEAEARVRDAQELNDWIDVKKRLNTGEQRAMFARMSGQVVPGEKLTLDSLQVGMSKVLEYLVGWSITDDGTPVPMAPDLDLEMRRATLNNLDPDSFREILSAIEFHEDEQERSLVAEKNVPAGESASSRTSPSPNISAGDTSGSMTSIPTSTM